MPFLVEQDTNLKRVVAQGTDSNGNEFRETESVVYGAGSVVYEHDIAPETLDRLEEGEDDHLSSLVKHISEDEAEKILAERGQTPPVLPEHEAEAEVLHQDGADVLTQDEVVEANPNGDAPPAEEEEVDLREGRKSSDPDSLRHKEVDQRRRKGGAKPKARAADSEDGGSEDDQTLEELRQEAAELGVEGRSKMNKDQLEQAVEEARSQQES